MFVVTCVWILPAFVRSAPNFVNMPPWSDYYYKCYYHYYSYHHYHYFFFLFTARKVFKYGVFSSPYFFPVFSSNTGKFGPEKTPYLDTLHTVIVIMNAPLALWILPEAFKQNTECKKPDWYDGLKWIKLICKKNCFNVQMSHFSDRYLLN